MRWPDQPAAPMSAPTGRPGDPAWYTRRIELALYVLAAASYIGLGIFHKFLLNWVIGPLWLVAWIWAAPAIVDRVLRRRAS
jgi:uncharacterized membrane-anchored protein